MINQIQFIFGYQSDVYLSGSRLYKSDDLESDYDFHIVSNSNQLLLPFEFDNVDLRYHTLKEFVNDVNNSEVYALECVFTNTRFKSFSQSINLSKLRTNFSKTASNSYVKCKKKLTIEKDFNPRVAKKSMFHAIRILDFGYQIAKFRTIIDYSSCNKILKKLNKLPDDWLSIEKEFKLVYNEYSSKFREVCSKE